MSTSIIQELGGALATAAGPVILPTLGSILGSLFKNETISRITTGTIWNYCMNNRSAPSDIEMEERGRSPSRGRPLYGRTSNRSPFQSNSRFESYSSGIRFNRTVENQAVRNKQRVVGLIWGGQLVAGIGVSILALLSVFGILSFALSPLALAFIGSGLTLSGLLATVLADHYKMDQYTSVPVITEDNWDKIDLNDPLNRSNLNNTFWFVLSSLVAPLSCLNLLLTGTSNGYAEREKYLANN